MDKLSAKYTERSSSKLRVINGVKHNFYQDFRLIQGTERGANNPVVYMPPHISSCTEHEITSYVIKTMYIRDGQEMDFTFCVSSETGLFDVYFGKDEITNLRLFGILPQSEHDQFFVDAIHKLADTLRPCMGIGSAHINFSKKTVVCKITHWEINAGPNIRHKYLCYHSH